MSNSILNSKVKKNYAKKLLMNECIPNEIIPIILQNTEKNNSKLIKTVLKNKDFDFNLLPSILKSTLIKNNRLNRDQKNIITSRIKFAETLINNKNFPNNCIWDILYYYWINNTNNEFAENLCNNKDFPPQEISSLLESITTSQKWNKQTLKTPKGKFKQNLTKRLISDPKCPNEYIADIINSINSNQKELFEQIYIDDNIPKSKIANILYLDYGLEKWFYKLNFSEKVAILINAVAIKDPTLKYIKKYDIDSKKVDTLVDKISIDMWIKKNNIPTEKIYKTQFLKNFILNNPGIENKIKNINLDIYKNGIPLKYSRML